MEVTMTKQEFHEHIAAKTGDDVETIKRLGFEVYAPSYETDRKEQKRLRRLKQWRRERRDKHLADIAAKIQS